MNRTDPWSPHPAGDRPARRLGDRGPLVLAVHGIEDGWRGWTPLARLLADRFRVVAVDPPWRSGNDYTWREDGSPGQWLAETAAALGEPVDVLLAHSFGANAALEALADGLRPGRAVLIAPSYRPSEHADDDTLRAESVAALDVTVRDGLRVRLGGRGERVGPDLLRVMADGLSAHLVPRAFPVFYRTFAASGRLDLAGVEVPTLVLGGPADPALAGYRAQGLARDFPAATVVLRAHYGHFCHIDQAAEVAAEIAPFLGVPIPDTQPCPHPVGGPTR
ncbi:alpha/beta hydrolase [Actinokineospora sp. PR83]|uniref:alpha/beta fold hydrolase n=1 Tax=Actinokineospora sp. PR83 TaxID=2884908 RepID=UPI001F29EDC1|nr:alpha/beta hydrolase [Actinokineospora sp. PR83]MCG8914803.1 alpha/beta hydrolase [Actinokineospora sp. PR83]